jgi:hypothetical protein
MFNKLLVAVGKLADVVSGLTTLVVAGQGLWSKVEKLIHAVSQATLR